MVNKKTLGIILGLLLVAGMVTAGVVKYLSNTAQVDVNIETPFTATLNGVEDTATAIDVYGGETITLDTTILNNANVNIDVYSATFVITSPTNWTGTEFSSITLTDRGTLVGDILSNMCHVRTDGTYVNFASILAENTKTIKLMACPGGVITKYTHPSGSLIDNKIEIVTNPAISPGSYNVKFCHLTDLTGTC